MHLIVVAYAVAPGPGGPEGHVNARFLQALAEYWPGTFAVITAGASPHIGDELLLTDHPQCTFYHIGETGKAGNFSALLSRWFSWSARHCRSNGLATRIPAKVINRFVYWRTGDGTKLQGWRITASRVLRHELERNRRSVVYSRALPFVSISAVANIRRKLSFPWIVNINDPMPADLWPGLYQIDSWACKRQHEAFRKVIPLIDAFNFPCRQLQEIELQAFPHIRSLPTAILPHITKPIDSLHKSNESRVKNRLEIAFAGTMRKKRIAPAFSEALKKFAQSDPDSLGDIVFAFHLARPNPYGEEFIRRLPANTSVTINTVDNELDDHLAMADVLLDLESNADQPLLLTKIANYIGFQKPIWAICKPQGTAWLLLNNYANGYTSNLDDSDSISETLKLIHKSWRNGTLKNFCPTASVVERFSAKRQVADLTRLIQTVIEKKERSVDKRIPEKITDDWP